MLSMNVGILELAKNVAPQKIKALAMRLRLISKIFSIPGLEDAAFYLIT